MHCLEYTLFFLFAYGGTPGTFVFLKQLCVLIIAYGGKHGAILVVWKCLLFVFVFAYVSILGPIYCYNQTRWESVHMVWLVGSLHGALRGILLCFIFVERIQSEQNGPGKAQRAQF